MRAALVAAVVLFAAVSFFPYVAVRIFTEDVPIIEEGVGYLGIVRFTYLFFAVTQILLATLRCVEIAGVAFGFSVMT